jgi:hypothetical protein
MSEVSPAIAASNLKVRRYVQSDIGKILSLAHEACEREGVPFSMARLKFVLDNNLRNLLLCVNVLIDLTEVVGVIIAQMNKNILNDDTIAEDSFFYLSRDYQDYVNLMYGEYVDWAKQRGCREVRESDHFMPGAISSPRTQFKVWKEAI